MPTIYKICAAEHWKAALHDGVFAGSTDDLRDGFIHFSTAEQLAETARRYFSGQHDLTLLHVDTATLGAALRWEPSRCGALFPHLYAPLMRKAVKRADPLALDAAGQVILPPLPA